MYQITIKNTTSMQITNTVILTNKTRCMYVPREGKNNSEWV